MVLSKFNKKNRPKAWKGADAKVQGTLPLLGNDAVALAALDDPFFENPKYLVRVTLGLATTDNH